MSNATEAVANLIHDALATAYISGKYGVDQLPTDAQADEAAINTAFLALCCHNAIATYLESLINPTVGSNPTGIYHATHTGTLQ